MNIYLSNHFEVSTCLLYQSSNNCCGYIFMAAEPKTDNSEPIGQNYKVMASGSEPCSEYTYSNSQMSERFCLNIFAPEPFALSAGPYSEDS